MLSETCQTPPKNAYCTIPFVGTSKKNKFYTDRKQMSGSCGHRGGLPGIGGWWECFYLDCDGHTGANLLSHYTPATFMDLHGQPIQICFLIYFIFSWSLFYIPLLPSAIPCFIFYFVHSIFLVQWLAHKISYINICQINKVSNTVLKCSFAYSPLANNSFCSNSSMNTKLKTSRQHKLIVKMQSNFSI